MHIGQNSDTPGFTLWIDNGEEKKKDDSQPSRGRIEKRPALRIHDEVSVDLHLTCVVCILALNMDLKDNPAASWVKDADAGLDSDTSSVLPGETYDHSSTNVSPCHSVADDKRESDCATGVVSMENIRTMRDIFDLACINGGAHNLAAGMVEVNPPSGLLKMGSKMVLQTKVPGGIPYLHMYCHRQGDPELRSAVRKLHADYGFGEHSDDGVLITNGSDVATLTTLARAYRYCTFVSDEIYEDFAYAPGAQFQSFSSQLGWEPNVVVLRGFSKSLFVGSWRIGYQALASYIANEAREYAQHIAAWHTRLVHNANVLADAFEEALRWRVARSDNYPAGGMYLVLRHGLSKDADAFRAALAIGVAAAPGSVFADGKETAFCAYSPGVRKGEGGGNNGGGMLGLKAL
ncbi:hypothetical protein HDU89_001550 [Geranomyces variabilis]|nr:hypothetical protein HDU89_001550 [Geranomyces variabilis]